VTASTSKGQQLADDGAERFEALYRRHFRAVLGYTLARLEPERAKDAAAETFLVAWRRQSDLPAEPLAWLLGVARKVVAEQLRADTRRDALTERITSTRPAAAGQSDPADEVAERESARTALACLPERDRELLRLIAWDGLPVAMAAEVLGLNRLTFSVRLHRARRRLASALAAADDITVAADASPARSLQPGHSQQGLSQLAGRHNDARSA
jgi:RNA polymerase sigma factor (sigma-70 family)